MISYIHKFFLYLFLAIPLSLITGPAIPDLTITFGGSFGLFWILFIEKRFEVLNNNFIKISIIFWLSLIIISFFAYNKENSFQDSIIFFRYLLIPICCYYLYFKNKEIFHYLLLFVFILVLFVSIDTLFQFFNYSSEHGFGKDILGFKSNWYGRLTGPFGDELIPGSYVSKFGLVGFAYILIWKKLKYKNIIQSFYLVLVLIVCFASGERMALATFSLALLILLLFLKNNRLSILVSIVMGLTIIFAIYKFHPFYNDFEVIESKEYHQGLKIKKEFVCENNKEKLCSKTLNVQPNFLEIIKNFNTSAYGEIYLLSYKMFKDNPLTGIGISNFKFLCENIKKYNEMMVNYNCTSHPHNTYVQWLTEGGILILSLFILYLIVIINVITYNEGDKTFKIISLVLLLILFWPVMSTGSLIKNWYGISVYFIIGISLCLSRLKIDN
tara:strand:- start:1091 stop:2413 length:1323 start_codon:yes stop_codon:yes gene_type:complete